MKQQPRTYLILALLSAFSLASCEASINPNVQNGPTPAKAVFVLNEGNFDHSNASLDIYNSASNSSVQNAIPNLGDVADDIELIGGTLYVVMNNSGKIYSLRPDTVRKIDSLEFPNGESPFRIAQISPTQAIVTQEYSTHAVILDLQDMKETGVIPIGSGNLGVAILDNRGFISSGADSLNVINLGLQSVTSMIKVGYNPSLVFADSVNNQIIVQCNGDFGYGPTPAAVYFINASTLQISDSIEFGAIGNTVKGSSFVYAIVGTTGDSVVSINLASHKIGSSSFTTNPTGYYNGGYDPVENELYLGEYGFSSNDLVDVFDGTTGAKKRSFSAGIAPAHFAFYR